MTHGKNYEKVEEAFRMKVFAENKHTIAKHNQLFAQGHRSYEMKMNHFGDLVSSSKLSSIITICVLLQWNRLQQYWLSH